MKKLFFTLVTTCVSATLFVGSTRRSALGGVVSTMGLGLAPRKGSAATVTGGASKRCRTVSNPAATTVTCLNFGVREGRLSGCGADEACVASSAVSNPSKFSPPWSPSSLSPEATDPQRAWRSVVGAVEEQPGLTVAERDDARFYLRATAVAAVPADGQDDIEFLLRVDSGAGAGPPRALFRSATRQSVYVYPLQQPVPNQQSHAERLEAIRLRLGWELGGGTPPGDSALEAQMGGQQVGNFFGLFNGARVPDYADEDS